MDCVLRCVLQLKQGIFECYAALGKSGQFGADELFPVLILTVLKANTPRLHTNMAYASRWRSPVALKSEAGCYFTHLQAAVSFLEGLAEEDETSGGQAVWKEHSGVPSTQQVPPLHSTGGGTALQGSGSSSSEGSVQADSGVHEASTRANVCDGGLQAMAGNGCRRASTVSTGGEADDDFSSHFERKNGGGRSGCSGVGSGVGSGDGSGCGSRGGSGCGSGGGSSSGSSGDRGDGSFVAGGGGISGSERACCCGIRGSGSGGEGGFGGVQERRVREDASSHSADDSGQSTPSAFFTREMIEARRIRCVNEHLEAFDRQLESAACEAMEMRPAADASTPDRFERSARITRNSSPHSSPRITPRTLDAGGDSLGCLPLEQIGLERSRTHSRTGSDFGVSARMSNSAASDAGVSDARPARRHQRSLSTPPASSLLHALSGTAVIDDLRPSLSNALGSQHTMF